MTSTRDLFFKSLYAVAGLAAVLLAGAEGGWLIPAALTVPIALAAWAVVERHGRGIPTVLANGLGVAAVVVALLELAFRDIEGRILFGAHLLVYLSWVLLWQEKQARQRWGLVALSVLQVAVGAVLTTAGAYGLGMSAFLVLTVWTLILGQLHEAEVRQSRAAAPHLVAKGPASLLAHGHVVASGETSFGRWPLRQILAAVAVTTSGAAAVGSVFFLFIPRLEVGRTSFDEATAPLARQRVTGFTETVRLGSFGEILESSVPVFEVRIFDGQTPLAVEDYAFGLGLDEPLFRGLTLRDYENGAWETGDQGRAPPLPRWPYADQIRQEYRLQPISTNVLFAIAPVYAGDVFGTDEQMRRQAGTGTLFRPARLRDRGELSYEVHSPSNFEMVRAFERAAAQQSRRDPEEIEPYLALPRGLDSIRRIAAGVEGRGDATPADRARRLLAWLRDEGGFRYSLAGNLVDPALDPVEDFLVNRKEGHCEYFASALALLLRAEGIPARVVSGFKGGQINRFTGAFEVQQRHAHAWVEAFLDGRWVTLDPSPPSGRSEAVAASAPPVPLWNDVRAAASNFWREYIVQMNLGTQRRTIEPLRELAVSTAGAMRENWGPALLRQIYALATDPSRWFSWQGAVATFLTLLAGVALWRIGRRLGAVWARVRGARAEQRRRGRQIAFYERFRRLCAREGWTVAVGQTPREFAGDVATGLAGRSLPPQLSGFPRELTEEFYVVRFGELTLSEERLSALDAGLTQLEAHLGNGVDRPAARRARTGAR